MNQFDKGLLETLHVILALYGEDKTLPEALDGAMTALCISYEKQNCPKTILDTIHDIQNWACDMKT